MDYEYLRKRRTDLGFTQKDIAHEMNISQNAVSKIEGGKHKNQAEMMGEYLTTISKLEANLHNHPLKPSGRLTIDKRLSRNLQQLKVGEGMSNEMIKAYLDGSEYNEKLAIIESRIKVLIDAWVNESSKTPMDFADQFQISESRVSQHIKEINEHVEHLIKQFEKARKEKQQQELKPTPQEPTQQEPSPEEPQLPSKNAYVEKHHKKAIDWAITFIEGSVLSVIQHRPDSMTDEKIEPYIRDCEKSLYSLIDFRNNLD